MRREGFSLIFASGSASVFARACFCVRNCFPSGGAMAVPMAVAAKCVSFEVCKTRFEVCKTDT